MIDLLPIPNIAHTPDDSYFNNTIHFEISIEEFASRIESRNLICVMDSLFYLERSDLVLVSWHCSVHERLLVSSSFLSLVALEYWYPYTVELYRCLLFIKFLE